MKNKGLVSTSYVRHLLNQAQAQGYDVENLLQEAGLSLKDIDSKSDFAADTFGQLYQRMMWIAQDEYFGMLGGGKVPNGTFRMMCYSIINAKTLEKAIYRASDFHEICRGTHVKPLLVRKGRWAKVSIAATSAADQDIETMLQGELPARIRTSLSMWHNFICWLIAAWVIFSSCAAWVKLR